MGAGPAAASIWCQSINNSVAVAAIRWLCVGTWQQQGTCGHEQQLQGSSSAGANSGAAAAQEERADGPTAGHGAAAAGSAAWASVMGLQSSSCCKVGGVRLAATRTPLGQQQGMEWWPRLFQDNDPLIRWVEQQRTVGGGGGDSQWQSMTTAVVFLD
jgi:hypothetical protein